MSIYCTTFKLQCGSITKRSTHLAPFNCCDHAVLASPRRSDIWSLSTVKYLLPRISILYILLHQFAVRCCIFMAIWISMWSVISTLHDWFIWFYFAWFCFLLQVQREAEEISNGLGLSIYSYFNLDIRRFFPLIRVLSLFHHSMRCFLFDVVYNKVAFEVGMLWTIVIDFEKICMVAWHLNWSSFKSLAALWGCTFSWIFGIHVLAGMRRWRRWWSPWRAPWTQPWRRRKHYNDLDYDYDNHDDNHHDDDYCIVDYSGCGMHYDSRCDT